MRRATGSALAVSELGLFCVLEGHELGDGRPEDVEVQYPHARSLPGCILGVKGERECEVHCRFGM